MKKLLPIIYILFLALSCTKAPEKEDVEGLVGNIENENCGNGLIDDREECDFSGPQSCNEDDATLIGPLKCDNFCKKDNSQCIDKETCSKKICNSNGVCIENSAFDVACKCYAKYRGENCSLCEIGYHYDFNGKCISNLFCTRVGCNYENEECTIVNGKATCSCNSPWQGDECDECESSYYLEDGKCKGKYCSNTEIICSQYEKCDSSEEKPKCVCISNTQNPEDCSECLSDYYMDMEEENICINTKYVDCTHNPDSAKGSYDIIIKKGVSYTDENGWKEPGHCEWKCPSDTYLENNICNIIKIYSSEEEEIRFSGPIGVNKDGELLASYREDVYKLSDRPELIYSADEYLFRPIIGIDNNIYYISGKHLAFFDTTSKYSYKFEEEINIVNDQQLSILNSGLISAGKYVVNKFRIDNYSTWDWSASTTISDQNGNVLLVEPSGLIVFFDSQLNILWEKAIDDPIVLYLFPVINKKGEAYIPYGTGRPNEFGIMAFDTQTGELLKNQIKEKFSTRPLISIDKDNNKYVSDLKKFGPDNKFIFEINNPSPSSNVTPVITNKKIYYAKGENVACINSEGETIWQYDTNDSIVFLFHHNDRVYSIGNNGYLYIFNAPGELEGEWPQYKQNSNYTGSLKGRFFTDELSRTQIISPEKYEVIEGDNVNFEWENDDLDAEFMLVKTAGHIGLYYIYGPTTGRSAQVSNINDQQNYSWAIITNNGSGIYSVENSIFSKNPSLVKSLYKNDPGKSNTIQLED